LGLPVVRFAYDMGTTYIFLLHVEIDESLKERESEIEVLYRKINELELRVENQEQYSRSTSLRFHNIRVPLNNIGRIKYPVDTDSIILDICQNNLSITDMKKEDIGRSHVIGKPNDGQSHVSTIWRSNKQSRKNCLIGINHRLNRPMVLEDTIHTCVQPAQDIHNIIMISDLYFSTVLISF
jgi:hypothetical protein